ncbi:MAG TPA: CvpA family protein [Chloroflexota bacterium]|nr:CvpA family protein [Chloroflexota bacterium]
MSVVDVMVLAILFFGIVGFWRGWLREVGALAGLLLSWLIVTALKGALVRLVNRLALIVVFTAKDGFDVAQPGTLIAQLKGEPLIDPAHTLAFAGVVVAVLALISYFASQRLVARPANASAQVLGALVGLVNGYLLAYLGFRYLAPGAALPGPTVLGNTTVSGVLGHYLTTLLVVGVVLVIAISLLSSQRLSGRGASRPAVDRGKN